MRDVPNRIILLMTATITPRNCPDAQFDPMERRRRYLKAFNFYLGQLEKGIVDGIVFAENSAATIEDFRAATPSRLADKVEFVCAPPEIFPANLRKNNEFVLIDYVVDNSFLLRRNVSGFFKVTGRYYFRNIKSLVGDVRKVLMVQNGELGLYCDQRDHRLYSRLGLKRKEQDGDTRFFFCNISFWRNNFYGYFRQNPEWRRVEDVMFEVAVRHYHDKSCRFRFRHQPLIGGNQYSAGQGDGIICMGVRLPPRLFFAIYHIRWLIESILRKIVPGFWF